MIVLLGLALAHGDAPGVLIVREGVNGCWESSFEAPPRPVTLKEPGCDGRIELAGAAEVMVLVEDDRVTTLSPERPTVDLSESSAIRWDTPLCALGLVLLAGRRFLPVFVLGQGLSIFLGGPVWVLGALTLVLLGREMSAGRRLGRPALIALAFGLAHPIASVEMGLEMLALLPLGFLRGRALGYLLGTLGTFLVGLRLWEWLC